MLINQIKPGVLVRKTSTKYLYKKNSVHKIDSVEDIGDDNYDIYMDGDDEAWEWNPGPNKDCFWKLFKILSFKDYMKKL